MYGENRARRVKKSLGSKYKELIPKKVNLKKKNFNDFDWWQAELILYLRQTKHLSHDRIITTPYFLAL